MTDWVESVSGPHGLQTAMALRLAINQVLKKGGKHVAHGLHSRCRDRDRSGRCRGSGLLESPPQQRQGLDGALGTVLVAKRLIPKGTSESSISAQNLFHVTTIPKVQIAPRAISDPAVLQGRVSAADIYPNEQLAASNFTTPH